MKYCVYSHSINGIVFYIGSKVSKNNRPYDKKQRNKDWWNFVNSNNGNYDVEIIKEFNNKHECLSYEMKLIREYHDKGQALASHQDYRGERNGMYGISRTGEQNPFYGKKHTEDTIKRIREKARKNSKGELNGMYGKTHTQESRKKISLNNGMRGKPSPTRKRVKLTLNDFTKEFDCVQHLFEFIKNEYCLNVSTCKQLLKTGKPYEIKSRTPKKLRHLQGLTLTYMEQ